MLLLICMHNRTQNYQPVRACIISMQEACIHIWIIIIISLGVVISLARSSRPLNFRMYRVSAG